MTSQCLVLKPMRLAVFREVNKIKYWDHERSEGKNCELYKRGLKLEPYLKCLGRINEEERI